MKRTRFLRLNLSSPIVASCKNTQQQSFGIILKKYEECKLKTLEVKIDVSRKHVPVEKKRIEYVNARVTSSNTAQMKYMVLQPPRTIFLYLYIQQY